MAAAVICQWGVWVIIRRRICNSFWLLIIGPGDTVTSTMLRRCDSTNFVTKMIFTVFSAESLVLRISDFYRQTVRSFLLCVWSIVPGPWLRPHQQMISFESQKVCAYWYSFKLDLTVTDILWLATPLSHGHGIINKVWQTNNLNSTLVFPPSSW